MREAKRNLPASIAARLRRRAADTGEEYQNVLEQFCFERFLHRLGSCTLRERFVLKGAMLLRLWSHQPYRATRDLDLLRLGNGTFEAIRRDLATICAAAVKPDGVIFGAGEIGIEAIRAEDEFAGARAMLPTRCGTARLRLQIDMGFGDSVWPLPQRTAYPAMLEFPPPEILAYPREAVVAEKLEAIIVLGDRNTRIKDFFDLHYLAGHFEFDRATLCESILRTLSKRQTPIPMEAPVGLTRAYWENPSRPAQVRAFARRAHLRLADEPWKEIAGTLADFLLPVLEDLRQGDRQDGWWSPGGPWLPAIAVRERRA